MRMHKHTYLRSGRARAVAAARLLQLRDLIFQLCYLVAELLDLVSRA